MSWPLPRRSASASLLLFAVAGAGCGPSLDDPLPPESDLYVYSLAVAEKARLRAPENTAKGLLHIGKVHERFGLEDKALEMYKRALETEPHLGDAYRHIGFIVSQRKDRMAEAIEAYQQCLRCEPDARGVLTRMGLLFTHMGKLDEALRALDDEIRGGTADESTHYNRGQVLALQGKYDDAIQSYGDALRIAPQMRSAYYGLAQASRAVGKKAEADEAERKFAELKKKEDEAEAAAGAAKTNLKEHLHYACATWMDAASLFAGEANATQGDATRFGELQREFVAAVGQAIRLSPGDLEPRKALIENFRSRGDYQGAARACEEALSAQPKNPGLSKEAHDLAGRILEPFGRNPAPDDVVGLSWRLLEKAIAARPDDADAHRECAKIILFRLGGRADLLPTALEHAAQAMKIDGSAASYDILAFAYRQNGRTDLAKQTLERGVELHPESKDLRERLEKLNAALSAGK